jgi:protein-S-isoprenylcysteine O-methyltransferase Ste14
VTVLFYIAWILAVVYSSIPAFWLLVHPFADFWRRQRQPFVFLVPAWILIWIALGTLTHGLVERPLTTTGLPWIRLLAFVPIATGIYFYRSAGRGFGSVYLSGLAELQPTRHEQRLVTTGVHARMRHPIYFAHLCMLTGWALAAFTLATSLLWLWGILSGAVMIILEDRELERRFGDEYRDYRKRVPAIIPW